MNRSIGFADRVRAFLALATALFLLACGDRATGSSPQTKSSSDTQSEEWISEETRLRAELGARRDDTSLPAEERIRAQLQTIALDGPNPDLAAGLLLDYPGLTKIPSFVFSAPHVQILIVRGEISEIPADIAQMKDLRHLSIGGSRIGTLPNEIGDLERLAELNCRGCRLKSLPSSIGGLKSLESLVIIEGELRELPSSIGQLKRLERLIVQGNQLEALPSEIGQLSSLEHLGLDDNALLELPTALARLQRLTVLTADRNQLRELPSELGQLLRLEQLSVRANGIRRVPDSFSGLDKLTTFIADGNPIEMLPAAWCGRQWKSFSIDATSVSSTGCKPSAH